MILSGRNYRKIQVRMPDSSRSGLVQLPVLLTFALAGGLLGKLFPIGNPVFEREDYFREEILSMKDKTK